MMELTEFQIFATGVVNPNDMTIAVITAVVCLFVVFSTFGLTFGFVNNPGYKPLHRILVLVAGVSLAFCLLYMGKHLAETYSPQNYESHMTCKYLLRNEKEEIEYFTLIPREARIFCSKPGTKVTRIKTPEYTKFFVEFEIPR